MMLSRENWLRVVPPVPSPAESSTLAKPGVAGATPSMQTAGEGTGTPALEGNAQPHQSVLDGEDQHT